MKPKLSEVDFLIFVNADAEYQAFDSSKTYDVGSDIPSSQLASARQQPDYVQAPYLGYEGVAMNFKVPPFDNFDARAAFCLALNREQLNATVLQGADIPSWHLVPRGMPGYNSALQSLDNAPTTGDPMLARQEWRKYLATLHGAPVPATQYTYDSRNQTATTLATALTNAWKQVLGANVQMIPIIWKSPLKSADPKRVQLYRWAWIEDYPDPQDFLSLLYATTSSYNENNSGSPAIDALMAQADRSLDNSARFSLYNQAEQALINDVSDCPLFQLTLNYRVRSNVQGYMLDPQGNVPTPDWPKVQMIQG